MTRKRGVSRAEHCEFAPALAEWRRQMAAGMRTASTFDDLWQAACNEQSGLEHEAQRLPEIAQKFRAEACRIIAKAARRGAA